MAHVKKISKKDKRLYARVAYTIYKVLLYQDKTATRLGELHNVTHDIKPTQVSVLLALCRISGTLHQHYGKILNARIA